MNFDIELTEDDVRVLYYAIHVAYERWPGSPQRPAEEQEHLTRLRAMFFAMQLEVGLNWEP